MNEAIRKSLSDIDSNWSFDIVHTGLDAQGAYQSVVVRLTVNGTTRSGFAGVVIPVELEDATDLTAVVDEAIEIALRRAAHELGVKEQAWF